jgi:uncharacterized protein YecE (DUF72 family)
MRAWVGTSGYSYSEWKGSFYPEDLPAQRMLRYYSERFRAVEINNTFYRMPTAKLLSQWSAQVPDGFHFALKAPRRITHIQRLQEADQLVAFLFETVRELGHKLGPVLFQLPPFLRQDLPRLEAFLARLPEGERVAIEFRHRSWFEDRVYQALQSRDVALCIADGELEGEVPLVSTASWGYLRLRRVEYQDQALNGWAERIKSQSWGEVFVFFKHEDEATGPKLAARFADLFGDSPRPPA